MEIDRSADLPGQTHIIGCGDIGRRVASLCLAAKTEPTAWVRSNQSMELCQQLGLISHQVDFDRAFNLDSSHLPAKVLYTVPPPPHGVEDTRINFFLAQLDPDKIQKFVLISTTGVYGDCGGKWIDETAAIRPKADRALRRVHAEKSLQRWANKENIETIVLRVPGIYALDRLPLKRLKSGAPLVRREQAPWTNRIHADDLASICFAALHSPVTNEVFNIADDSPSTMTDYFRAIADYAGLPYPPEISLQEARQQLSQGMLSYLDESRRIKNDKMKRLLHIKLRYPDLAHGLMGDRQA